MGARKQRSRQRPAAVSLPAGRTSRRWPAGWLVALAIAVFAGVGLVWLRPGGMTAAVARTPDQNVLLVTIDTLRADALGSYGGGAATPTLDGLAADGVRFDFAHAHAVLTLPSHASILTGLYPFTHGIRDNSGYRLADDSRTAARVLKQAGFATAGFVAAFPLDSRFGLAQGFDTYDDAFGEHTGPADFTMAERPAGEVVDRARGWISARQGKWFTWVHVFDPHATYSPPPPFDTQYAGRPYLGEVAYVDAALKPLLDTARSGVRPTLVVVTSDHGEALGDHGELTHGIFAYESTLKVPLIVAQVGGPAGASRPSRTGRVSHVAARHIDLLPTILDALGLDVPADLPGRTLMPAIAGHDERVERTSYFEAMSATLNRGWAPLRGVLAGREKFIDLPIPELYALDQDAAERHNLAAAEPERGRALEARLTAFGAALPGVRTREEREVAAQLRALGYVSGSAPRQAAYTEADDPKRLIGLDSMIQDAIDRFQNNRPQEAATIYRSLIAQRPDMGIAHRHLAFIEWQTGDVRAAVRTLRAALSRGVTEAGVPGQLGIYLAETGQAAEAIPLLEAAVSQNPTDLDALNALGIAYARDARLPTAVATFQRILTMDPTNSMALENIATIHLQRNELEAARNALERAVAAGGGSARAHTSLGVLARRRGDLEGALRHWRTAIQMDPTEYDALFNLGTELMAAGRTAEARTYLERFIRQAPPGLYGPDIQRITQQLRDLQGLQ